MYVLLNNSGLQIVEIKAVHEKLKGISRQLPIPWARKMVKRLRYALDGGGDAEGWN